ncbi:MAG: cell division protein FtsZ [Candidatus Limimorpha sp.]
MTDLIRFEAPEKKPNIIKVMGVGGGGSNAVTHMYSDGITGVDFVLCNTDDQALQKSPVENKLHLGNRALGAGNIPAVGREAAEKSEEGIREILGDVTKMLFITAGMGGGTGTGAAPVVARIARDMNILTVGIVTLPFSFEGKRRQQQAQEGIAELRKYVDALLVISNDKLREEYGNMKLTDAFKKADDVLKIAAKGIAEIITVTGYVNVDFEDVNNVMRNSGKAIMGSGYATGEGRALNAVEEAVHSPLLDDSDITGAKNILVYITSGTEEVSLDEVTEINEYVQTATGKVSEVIWGNGEDMSLEDGIRVTLIATGFEEKDVTDSKPVVHTFNDNVLKSSQPEDTKTQTEPKKEEIHSYIKDDGHHETDVATNNKEQEMKVVKRHHLYDETTQTDDDEILYDDASQNDAISTRIVPDKATTDEPSVETTRRYSNPFITDDDDVDVPNLGNITDNQVNTMTMMDVKQERKKKIDHNEMLRRQRLKSMSTDFKTQIGLENMENIPAYMRQGISVSDEENEQVSNYSVNVEHGLREKNSYLHYKVD